MFGSALRNKFGTTWLLPICLFVVVLLVHGYYGLTHVPFSQDQARDLYLVEQNIAQGKYFPGYGPKTSVGDFTVPPLYFQIFTLVQLLFKHPLSMYVAVLLIESVTPVLLYFLLQLFVERSTAVVASLLYAVSTLVLYYSTFAWSPNLVPFFTMLIGLSWMTFLVKNNPKFLCLGVVALACNLHFHFQTVVLIPFSLVVFAISIYRSKKNLLYWAGGLLLGGLTYAPYVFAELTTNWSNTRQIISFYTLSSTAFFDTVSKPEYVLSFFPSFIERVMFERNFPYLLLGRGLFFIGFGVLTWRAIKQQRYRWLWLYLGSILLSIIWFKGVKLDYYLMTLFSLPAILLASIFDGKKFALPILLLFFVPLGFKYAQPSYNSYNTVQQNIQLINKAVPDSSAHVIFHDLDIANVYLYGISRFSDLTLDKNHMVLIDICSSGDGCRGDSVRICQYNSINTYSQQLKYQNGYTSLLEIRNGGFKAVVGVLDTENPARSVYPSGLENRKDLLSYEIN